MRLLAAWVQEPGGGGTRAVTRDDLPLIGRLHEAEFLNTYASAEQLIDGALAGTHVVLVAARTGGGVAGYAAGQVHSDGEGFIDFVAVAPEARGGGIGCRLVTTLTRLLHGRSPLERLALLVQDHRTAARALYERLGFRSEGPSWRTGRGAPDATQPRLRPRRRANPLPAQLVSRSWQKASGRSWCWSKPSSR